MIGRRTRGRWPHLAWDMGGDGCGESDSRADDEAEGAVAQERSLVVEV